MYRIYFYFLMLLFQVSVLNTGLGQCDRIYNGSITLSTQAEVDAFAAEGYCEVTGFLVIGESNSNITSLSSLNNITSVGALDITNNTNLGSLSGLNNIFSVTQLRVINNPILTSLSGLENIISIENSLWIGYNGMLKSLIGLDNIASVGNIIIENNPVLNSLSVLDNITSVSLLTIYNNNALSSLFGLDNITSVESSLSISDNSALNSLSGLDNITSVGNIIIENNPVLNSLSGLDNITSVMFDLSIKNNAVLTSCCSVQALLVSGVGRNIDINNNNTGCDTPIEIIDLCTNNCRDIEVTGASTSFTVSNIPARAKIEYLGRETGYAVKVLCEGNCGTSQTVSELTEGEYKVKVQTFNPYCFAEYKVMVNRAGNTNNQPDLKMTNLEVDPNQVATKGGIVSFNFDLHNLGNVTAEGAYQIAVYLSTTKNLNASAVRVGEVNTGNTPVGTIADVVGALTVPINQAIGDYYIILKADAGNTIIESNEANNLLASVSSITVSAGNNGHCDKIYEGDIALSTQAEVDAFTAYGYCEITGSLIIGIIGNGLTSNIRTLTNLSNIRSVGGDLVIINNQALGSLAGLNNVVSVGNVLAITNNDILNSLEGLDNINTVGNSLLIQNNDKLESLIGLGNIVSIESRLVIVNNNALTSLTGFANINIINIGETLMIQGNKVLSSLVGLDNVASVGRMLDIVDNDALSSLIGLNNINTVGVLRVLANNKLSSLEGLNNLVSIKDGLIIGGNEKLSSLEGLNNLRSVGENIEVVNNDALTSCCAIQVLLANGGVVGNILIRDNDTGCDSQTEIATSCDNTPNGDCTDVTVVGTSGGFFEVANIPAGAKIEYLGRGTGYAVKVLCEGNCDISQTVSGLTEGEYTVKVQSFNPYCYAEYKVQVAVEECFCPSVFDPVCGEDGKTYNNSCEAACAGIVVVSNGECGACVCPAIYEPVCGADGKTYANKCEAACAGIVVVSNGECGACEYPVLYRPAYHYIVSQKNKIISLVKKSNEGQILWSKNYTINNNDPIDVFSHFEKVTVKELDNDILLNFNYFFSGAWTSLLIKTDLNGNEVFQSKLNTSLPSHTVNIVGKSIDGGYYLTYQENNSWIDLVKSDAQGHFQWRRRLGGDLVMHDVHFVGEPADGSGVYYIFTGFLNTRSTVNKLNVNDGSLIWEVVTMDVFSPNRIGTHSYIPGAVPTSDGGIVVGHDWVDLSSYFLIKGYEYGKLDKNGNMVWWHDPPTNLAAPMGTATYATSDGGYIFVNNTQFTKVNSEGFYSPECDPVNTGDKTIQCGEITINYGGNSIEMKGQSNKNYFFKVHDLNNRWAEVFSCSYQCGSSQTASNLATGKYIIRIYNDSWDLICEQEIQLGTAGSRAQRIELETFNVYPNPAQEVLNIDLTKYIGAQGELVISNIYGQIMHQQTVESVTGEALRLSLEDFTNGVYALQFRIKNRRMESKKFLVKRMY